MILLYLLMFMPSVKLYLLSFVILRVFSLSKVEDPHLYSTYFMKIDNVKFKRKVIPGDTIVFDLKLISPIRRGLVHMGGKGYVNGQVCIEAEMLAQVVKDRG